MFRWKKRKNAWGSSTFHSIIHNHLTVDTLAKFTKTILVIIEILIEFLYIKYNMNINWFLYLNSYISLIFLIKRIMDYLLDL